MHGIIKTLFDPNESCYVSDIYTPARKRKAESCKRSSSPVPVMDLLAMMIVNSLDRSDGMVVSTYLGVIAG